MTLSYGVKVSKPGQDVKTSENIDTQFSTKFSTLKMLTWDDVSITTNGSGDGAVSIEHDLGFAPAHYVFRKGTAQLTFLDASSHANSFTPVTGCANLWMGGNYFTVYSNPTHLVIEAAGQEPNTTYYFRYYLFIDLAEDYTGVAGITLDKHYGIKVSKDGFDVKTAKEYQLAYSQNYKSLQYYDENYKTQILSLPLTIADPQDTTLECGTYVDINHGLGYPAFFIAYALTALSDGFNVLIPYSKYYGTIFSSGGIEAIDGFCDSTKIRLSFYRKSVASSIVENGAIFPEQSIKIKCFIFTEDLSA